MFFRITGNVFVMWLLMLTCVLSFLPFVLVAVSLKWPVAMIGEVGVIYHVKVSEDDYHCKSLLLLGPCLMRG